MTYTITYKTSSGGSGSLEVNFVGLKEILQGIENNESIAAYSVEDLNTKTDLARDLQQLKQDYRKLKVRSEL